MPSPHRSTLQAARRKGKKFGPNQVVYGHLCDHCGKTFYSSRPDAKYDTPKCRAAAHRKRVGDARRKKWEEYQRRRALEREAEG